MMKMFRRSPTQLSTPHIPLGVSVGDVLRAMRSTGNNVTEDIEGEHCFRLSTATFSVAIYPKGDTISSVWYDDPIGRGTPKGRKRKIELYMQRYGPLSNWQLRLDNGWMLYWFNPTDKVALVYGVHKDVLRFNQYNEGLPNQAL